MVGVEREMASYYDAEEGRDARPLDHRRLAARAEFVDIVRARRIAGPTLEIGTGPGRDALALRAAGLDTIGIDLSFGHAARAASRGVTMAVASVRDLPLVTRSVAALWSMSTLMHVPAVAIGEAMGEIARVLVPGATACIGVWGGADSEQFTDVDAGSGARRLFSRSAEPTWRSHLETIGRIDDFRQWPAAESGDDAFRYYLAFVTAHPADEAPPPQRG